MRAPALLLIPGEDWPAIAALLDASAEPWPVEAARVDLVWWLAVYGCADVVTLGERWRRGDSWVRERLDEARVQANRLGHTGRWSERGHGPTSRIAREQARARAVEGT